ncbi:MAG: phasin family protein [Betaproteobacteria bacterium]
MLKKAKAGLAAAKADEGASLSASMSQSVLKSSHQIWLAGLGAFAKAQSGGAKVFEALVQQGSALESKTRKAAASTAEAARDAATSKAKEMHAMAGGTWDKLEQVFQERVARALKQLGVYTSSDVERLSERVNELSEAVNALLKAQGIVPPKSRSSPVKRMVAGAMNTATRTAARTVSSATGRAAKTVSKATRTARKTVRTAGKIAKAALK